MIRHALISLAPLTEQRVGHLPLDQNHPQPRPLQPTLLRSNEANKDIVDDVNIIASAIEGEELIEGINITASSTPDPWASTPDPWICQSDPPQASAVLPIPLKKKRKTAGEKGKRLIQEERKEQRWPCTEGGCEYKARRVIDLKRHKAGEVGGGERSET